MSGPFQYMLLVVTSIVLAIIGLILLANFKRLFRKLRPEWLRKMVVVWLIFLCFVIALAPINGQLIYAIEKQGWFHVVIGELILVTAYSILVFNTARIIAEHRVFDRLSFVTRNLLVMVSIIITTIGVTLIMHVLNPDATGELLKYTLLVNSYFSIAAGLVFILVSYLNIEQKRRFDEKELELSRLRELKSRAELEALSSKVNPHFLYNSLNSIAELALLDGRKARKMTIALADLFRYSMNYSGSNYSTLREELEMTELYLQIEKIRFEDQLNYSVKMDETLASLLVPRFILQPLVENAVKHGLRVTGQMTEISIVVDRKGQGVVISIADNGPGFPDELSAGYGVKSVYDKMDLLYPQSYDIYFMNKPEKKVSIHFHKLTG
ncbi:MAG: histidine kinase [Chitinophagaceae bacterium]